jgi:hypothetical protein
MEAALWSIVAVVGAAFLVGMWRLTGRLLQYAASATADRVVDRMGDILQGRWEASIDLRLRPIEVALDAIDAVLTLNGGDTVKDAVWQLRDQMSDLQHQIEAVLTDR